MGGVIQCIREIFSIESNNEEEEESDKNAKKNSNSKTDTSNEISYIKNENEKKTELIDIYNKRRYSFVHYEENHMKETQENNNPYYITYNTSNKYNLD